MHFLQAALFAVVCTGLTAAAPFWGVFEQTPLTSYFTATTRSTVKSALKKADIIPDVLNHDFKPRLSLLLSYPSTHDHVLLGNVLPPSNVTSRPTFEIHSLSRNPTPTQKNTTYTLVLSDPDATSRAEPVKAQMCHWIVSGLKLQAKDNAGSGFETYALDVAENVDQDLVSENDKNGLAELMSYVPPTPPPKTGYHRYVFVLLAPEDPKDSGKKLQKPKDRPHWGYGEEGAGVQEWAEDNGLVAVGANFFYAQNEKQ